MSAPVCIVAVIYEEPEYVPIREAIARAGVPVAWVDRRGVGSLVKAYNEGFREAREMWAPELVWFMSNVEFGDDLLPRLLRSLRERPDFAAIQPPYASDHPHLQPDGSGEVKEGPFVEFTCPLVRAVVYAEHPLDELMPYWGHDLDWGYRVRRAGWKVGVDHGAPTPEHTYIRNILEPHPVTERRHELRKRASPATKRALIAKYGPDWRAVLEYA